MPGIRSRVRTATWLTLFGLLLAACSGATSDATDAAAGDASDQATADSGDNGDSGSDGAASTSADDPPPFPWEVDDPPASVPLSEIRRGGPPPDGIPPIDDPSFEDVEAAGEWLTDQDPVLLVDRGDDTRAYPLAIMTFHEIVNDEVGGDPLVVTYCPLCNSGLVFERTVDGEVLDFGTSGRLWNSNLVMYDRSTRSLWSQFTGEAIVGERLGTTLERVPMQIVAFSDFAEQFPDGQVLSRDTGHNRPYGSNPYVGYDSAESPFLFDGETGGDLPQMARIVTTGGDADPVAYPLDTLQKEQVITDTVDGDPVVVFWAPGTASALDAQDISEAADVGATGVFRPVADGQELTFVPEGDEQFRDTETGSTWTVLGTAVDGPLAGEQLERVPHDDTFWFVQFAFRPETRVVGSG
ncbi:MAG: DUF3179 domain-containing protein [Actinobacteria bacterium]|nr:DUF3179 domain-containing protein [Actinomycetota bacterium]